MLQVVPLSIGRHRRKQTPSETGATPRLIEDHTMQRPKSISQLALEAVKAQRARIEERRAAAVHAFWSDDPLNLTFRQETGKQTFSLKAFIAFVVDLPQEQFEACTRGGLNAH